MKIEILGVYKGEKTGTLYTILRKTRLNRHRSLSSQVTEFEGSHEYKSDCGMDLKRMSDDLSKFETVNLIEEADSSTKCNAV